MWGGVAAARTIEVQIGEDRVALERGSQLLGPLGADPIACGARCVGAASACGLCVRGWPHACCTCVRACAVRRGGQAGGGGLAARTSDAQRSAALLADLLQRLSEPHPKPHPNPATVQQPLCNRRWGAIVRSACFPVKWWKELRGTPGIAQTLLTGKFMRMPDFLIAATQSRL